MMEFEYYMEELKKHIDKVTSYNRGDYDKIILKEELFYDFLKLWDENRSYSDYFMKILEDIDINMFTEKSVEFMLENDIAVDYISHLPLNIALVRKIAEKNEDAKYMLFYRLISEENYDEGSFAIEFNECYSDDIYEYIYSLIDKIEHLPIREEVLDYVAIRKSENKEIVGMAHKRIVARKLLFEKDRDKLFAFVERNDYIFDLKICKNIFAPKEILQKLANISDIKYGKRIRRDALKTLRLKELLDK